jgi:hypothetical protein
LHHADAPARLRHLQQRSHFDDSGLIIEAPSAASAAAPAAPAQHQHQHQQQTRGEQQQAAAALGPEALLQQRLQEAIAAGAAPAGTTVDQVMDQMAAFVAEATGGRCAP